MGQRCPYGVGDEGDQTFHHGQRQAGTGRRRLADHADPAKTVERPVQGRFGHLGAGVAQKGRHHRDVAGLHDGAGHPRRNGAAAGDGHVLAGVRVRQHVEQQVVAERPRVAQDGKGHPPDILHQPLGQFLRQHRVVADLPGDRLAHRGLGVTREAVHDLKRQRPLRVGETALLQVADQLRHGLDARLRRGRGEQPLDVAGGEGGVGHDRWYPQSSPWPA